jgi:hypothetical protein
MILLHKLLWTAVLNFIHFTFVYLSIFRSYSIQCWKIMNLWNTKVRSGQTLQEFWAWSYPQDISWALNSVLGCHTVTLFLEKGIPWARPVVPGAWGGQLNHILCTPSPGSGWRSHVRAFGWSWHKWAGAFMWLWQDSPHPKVGHTWGREEQGTGRGRAGEDSLSQHGTGKS